MDKKGGHRTHQVNNQILYTHIKIFSDLIGNYIIAILSAIGLICNSIGLLILCNKRLKHKFYKYMIVKTLIDLLVCFFGVIYLNVDCLICKENVYNSYEMLFFKWYIVRIPMRIIYLASSAAENFLILTSKTFLKDSTAIMAISIVFISVPSIMPLYFMNNLQETSVPGIFVWNSSNVGGIRGINDAYLLTSFLCNTFLHVASTVLLTTIGIYKYKSIMHKKRSLGIPPNKKTEYMVTRSILILSLLFIVSRIIDLIGGLGRAIVRSFNQKVTYEVDVVINLVRQLANLTFIAVSAFTIVIYIKMDRNMKAVSKEYIKIIKSFSFTFSTIPSNDRNNNLKAPKSYKRKK